MPTLKDLTGHTFGRLTVLSLVSKGNRKQRYWLCHCECGETKEIAGSSLRSGLTRSCGCLFRETHTTHGRTGSLELKLLISAKHRAKTSNLPFDLALSDIVIPSHCPILGIELKRSNTFLERDSSPSIDQIVPHAGYTKNNFQIISWRANRFKSDATPQELKTIAEYMEKLNGQTSDEQGRISELHKNPQH
jgi:hypothetical protein